MFRLVLITIIIFICPHLELLNRSVSFANSPRISLNLSFFTLLMRCVIEPWIVEWESWIGENGRIKATRVPLINRRIILLLILEIILLIRILFHILVRFIMRFVRAALRREKTGCFRLKKWSKLSIWNDLFGFNWSQLWRFHWLLWYGVWIYVYLHRSWCSSY